MYMYVYMCMCMYIYIMMHNVYVYIYIPIYNSCWALQTSPPGRSIPYRLKMAHDQKALHGHPKIQRQLQSLCQLDQDVWKR